MTAIYDFLAGSPYFFGAVFAAFLLVFSEAGYRLGAYRRRLNENRPDETTSIVVGSILGLLAFVLALTLSNATTRYQQRQDSALSEANAISTAWLQAGAAGGDRAAALQGQISEYIEARYVFMTATAGDGAIAAADQKTNDLQTEIWREITALVAEAPTPMTGSLMNAVNNMFDSSTVAHYAMAYHMPAQIIMVLFFMSMTAMAGVGYQFGQLGRSARMPSVVLAVVWTIIITQIMDVGSARIWSLHTDARMYEWTMSSMGIALPPAE